MKYVYRKKRTFKKLHKTKQKWNLHSLLNQKGSCLGQEPTCSTSKVGGNMSLTSVCNEVYDFTSIQWLIATSPCWFPKHKLEGSPTCMIDEEQRKSRNLGVDDENLSLGDSYFLVAKLIGVSVAKASIEGVVIGWKKSSNVLTN